jgi:hypothetical protein
MLIAGRLLLQCPYCMGHVHRRPLACHCSVHPVGPVPLEIVYRLRFHSEDVDED